LLAVVLSKGHSAVQLGRDDCPFCSPRNATWRQAPYIANFDHILYRHVPKSGGSNMKPYLEKLCSSTATAGCTMSLAYSPHAKYFPGLPVTAFAYFRDSAKKLIYGHALPYGHDDINKRTRTTNIMMLRDPMSWAVSYYNMIEREGQLPKMNGTNTTLTFSQWANSPQGLDLTFHYFGMDHFYRYFVQNGVCNSSHVWGPDDFRDDSEKTDAQCQMLAQRNPIQFSRLIQKCLREEHLVLLHEHYDTSLALLETALFGVEPWSTSRRSGKANADPKKGRVAATAAELRQVNERLYFQHLIYQSAVQQFEEEVQFFGLADPMAPATAATAVRGTSYSEQSVMLVLTGVGVGGLLLRKFGRNFQFSK